MHLIPVFLLLGAYSATLIGATPVDGRCTDYRAYTPSLKDLSYISRHAIPHRISSATESTIHKLEPGFHELVYQGARAIDSSETFSRFAARHAVAFSLCASAALFALWMAARCGAARYRTHRKHKEWGRKARGSFYERSRPRAVSNDKEFASWMAQKIEEKDWDVRWAREASSDLEKGDDVRQGVRLY